MSLTDKRIEEILKEVEPHAVRLPLGWKLFARAIEAEATKPQITGGETYPDSTEADKERLSLALDKIWGKKPQEPVGYQELFDAIAAATSVACFPGINISIEDFTAKIGPLYATPQPCPKCAEGMVSVTKEEANNYCRILTLLGMEEEGSPVEGVERLISLREGMTCGDCNDTGWLENREEGRYPCTCMTEAEPYQILEAERDDWKSRYESNLSVNQMHSDNNAEMLKFNAKLLAKRDALAITVHQLREAIKRQMEADDRLMNAPFNVRKEEYEAALEEHSASHDAFVKLINEKLINEPDTTVNIIKRHDAAVLAEVVERIIDAASAGSETGVEVVRTMIKEIGAQL